MSAVKSGSSLRALLLTPERVPSFFIPSRSPHIGSPWPHRRSPERTRLLSDHEDDTPGATPPGTPTSYGTSSRFLFPFPSFRNGRPRCDAAAAPAAESDSDPGAATLPAASLLHVGKVTTPHGFRAVSPSTSQVQSLFHRNKPVKVTVTQPDPEDPAGSPPPAGRLRVSLRPVKAFGLQVMKELKKPAAALKVLTTSPRIAVPR